MNNKLEELIKKRDKNLLIMKEFKEENKRLNNHIAQIKFKERKKKVVI